MINIKRLKDSLYTEPYEPYVYCPTCLDCLMKEGKGSVRLRAEGKEGKYFKLYVRFVCPINSEHNGDWYFHRKRPLKFRIKKRILRKLGLNKKIK